MESNRNAIVVTLAPSQDVESVSFEDAFGEFSNAAGRFAKKRAARVEARQEAKRDIKQARAETEIAKKENKAAVKVAKQQNKAVAQQAKQERKAVKKVARVDKRAVAQQARQAKKTGSMQMRQERKGERVAMRQERRAVPEPQFEQPMIEDESLNMPVEQGGSYPSEQSFSEPTYNEQNYAPEQSYEPEYSEDEPVYEEESYEEEQTEIPYEDEGFSDPSYGVDGEENMSYIDSDPEPRIVELTDKLAWNKELIALKTIEKTNLEKKGKPTNEVQAIILERLDRVSQLEGELNSYINFEGEFSGVDGEPSPMAKGSRFSKVRKAKTISNGKIQRARERRKILRSNGGDATPVDVNVTPEFAPQRIVVPAETQSNFTGDNAPKVIKLNASVKKDINWTGVIIGVGLAGLAIYALNKYKVLSM